MLLKDLATKYDTDKNTIHSYIDHLYEDLFIPIKYSASNILEIGINTGGSILLWENYFPNAIIHGVDINHVSLPLQYTNNRIKTYCNDAYHSNFIDSLLDNYFDIIIDDGPHTIESMIIFVSKYLLKIKSKAYLVLEDIQDISWVNIIISHIDQSLLNSIMLYDLRHIKYRYDDIALVIQKI